MKQARKKPLAKKTSSFPLRARGNHPSPPCQQTGTGKEAPFRLAENQYSTLLG